MYTNDKWVAGEMMDYQCLNIEKYQFILARAGYHQLQQQSQQNQQFKQQLETEMKIKKKMALDLELERQKKSDDKPGKFMYKLIVNCPYN